jgi:hypothetical protein
MPDRPPRYVVGVVIPPRIAHELVERFDLNPLRFATQGNDPEFYDVLHALAWASQAWAISLERSTAVSEREAAPVPRETAASSELLVTKRVADKLGLSHRRVQQLAKAGELEARQIDGRWSFTAHAVQAYRDKKAA